jgi:hypothetical protein
MPICEGLIIMSFLDRGIGNRQRATVQVVDDADQQQEDNRDALILLQCVHLMAFIIVVSAVSTPGRSFIR